MNEYIIIYKNKIHITLIMGKESQDQKYTVLALRHLKKTFYKFMMHGLTYKYNSHIVPKESLVTHCKTIKTDLKDYISVKNLDMKDDFSKIYNFISRNFFEQETYRIKVPTYLLKWFLDGCTVKALMSDDDILSLVAYKLDRVQIDDIVTEHVNVKLVTTDKFYRNKHLAEKLLAILEKECIDDGHISSVFMSNIGFMKPFAQLKYYYRPINPEILIQAGFSGFKEADLKNRDQNILEYYRINTDYSSGFTFKPLQREDTERVYELYNENREKYNYSHLYTGEELTNMLCNDAVSTYCVWKNGEIEDFVSFYKVYHESVVNRERRDVVVGNVFMYTTVNTTVYTLFKNLLTLMASQNIDLMSTLNNQDIDCIIEPLQFLDSESYNYVYLFNWHVLDFKPDQICSVICF